MANSMEGQETVHSVVGPLAHSVPGHSSAMVHNIGDANIRCRLEIVLDLCASGRALEVRFKGYSHAMEAGGRRCYQLQNSEWRLDLGLLQL